MLHRSPGRLVTSLVMLVTVVTLLLASSGPARAQVVVPVFPPGPPAPPVPPVDDERARNLRDTGRVLVATAALSLGVSMGLVFRQIACWGKSCAREVHDQAAKGLLIAGLSAGVIGAVLWPVGHVWMNRIHRRARALRPVLAPTRGGGLGGLAMRF